MRLGPKYCLYKRLNEEDFETDLEECVMKVKWDMLGEGSDNESKKRRKSEDIALEVLLGEEKCRKIDEEKEEEEEIKEAESRSIFNWNSQSINCNKLLMPLSLPRMTDC